MAKTHLDQLVEYPSKIIRVISNSKECVGLLIDKAFNSVNDDDYDEALDNYLMDYEYVDNTVETSSAYIWVETEVKRVENHQIKEMKLYVTIACHKRFMKLDGTKFRGVLGNRRDNLVRYVDALLNGAEIMGIGKLKLESVLTRSSINEFSIREMTYDIYDFNQVSLSQ